MKRVYVCVSLRDPNSFNFTLSLSLKKMYNYYTYIYISIYVNYIYIYIKIKIVCKVLPRYKWSEIGTVHVLAIWNHIKIHQPENISCFEVQCGCCRLPTYRIIYNYIYIYILSNDAGWVWNCDASDLIWYMNKLIPLQAQQCSFPFPRIQPL